MSSHPQLIEVREIKSTSHPECSNIAEVANVQPKEFKNVVWVTAKDLRTHQTLTVQVRNSVLERLEIFSHFRQINKGDNHELEVRAYDDEGSIFNSLEGFKFDWVILAGHDNIRRITPKDAGLTKMHKEVNAMNDDDFYMKALLPGFTNIKVKILEPGYEKVSAATIKLTIVEPIVIQPKDDSLRKEIIRILPTSEFEFKLQHVTMNGKSGVEFADIQIPNK